jgi:hypothetical protein
MLMPATPPRRDRIIRAAATLTVTACLALLTTATLAQASLPGASKSCVHINGCSGSASSPPTAFTGGQPATSSHLTVAVATASKSTAKARHASGTLITNAGAGRIRCGGYRFKAPTTFQFQLQATTSATSASVARIKLYITYEITERITNAPAAGIQFCLGADFAFKTLSGRPAPARRLPDGTRGHVGLLPPCPVPLPPPGATKAPCLEPVTTVKNQNSTTGVDVILRARVPTLVGVASVRGGGDLGGGDPWGGG